MKKQTAVLFTAALLISAQSFALPSVRQDITIFDGDGGNYSGGDQRTGVMEDSETEPGMVNSQVWDFESVFIDNSNGKRELGLIGGFDFINGVDGFAAFSMGDIFISTDNNFIAGNATRDGSDGIVDVKATTFGYELVIDVEWEEGTYEVYQIIDAAGNSLADVSTPFYTQNFGSGGFKLASTEGLANELLASGEFSYESGLTDTDTGFDGGNHYAAFGFDLGFLNGADFTVSTTQGCGNDHLLGQQVSAVSVPEPSSIALLGLGILGLSVLRKRAV